MMLNEISMPLEISNDLKDINSKVCLETTPSKKTNPRKTNGDNSKLVSFTPKTDVTLLPSHFNQILCTFVSLDMVVNKLIKQRSPLYFDKISEVLKEMNIKNFDLNTFGQILRVFRESYFYEFEKPPLKITRHYKEKLKLIPNLDFGNPVVDPLPRKRGKCLRLDELILRRSCFHERLLQIVQEKHIVFLVDVKKMSRSEAENASKDSSWHAEFNVESAVGDLQPIMLDRNTETRDKLNEKSISKEDTKTTATKSSPVPISRLSISRSPRDIPKENAKPLTKSRLGAINKSGCKLAEEKISSSPKEIDPQLKRKENTKPVCKSPLSTNNNLPTTARQNDNKSIGKSPQIFLKTTSNLRSDAKKSDFSRKSIDKENKSIIVESPSRKSIILESPSRKSIIIAPEKTTPARPASRSILLSKGDPINNNNSILTPPNQRLNQSRLSWATVGMPNKGNYIANLAVPDSPMLKDDFFLKQKLPSHLRNLFEMFISLEKLIYKNHRENKSVYLSMICSQPISKHKFTELQLGRIVSIYPEAYSLRWDKLASLTNPLKLANKSDIVISPNLCKSNDFLRFDFQLMKERRKKFLENCFEIVISSYRNFLVKNEIALENIEEHIKSEDWNKSFNIDLHVRQIEPAPMPLPPKTQERLTFSVIKKRQTDLIDPSAKVVLKADDKLKSLSQSLMDKVLQNKAKSMIYRQKPGVKLSLLPELVKIISTEFERSKHAPIGQSHVANIVSKSLFISQDSFNDYVNKIVELVPEWLEKLKWTNPTLSLSRSNMSLDDVQARLEKIIAEQT